MYEDVYSPLQEYRDVYRGKFKEISESTFDAIVKEAGIDIEANRQTCRKIDSSQKELSSARKKKRRIITVCILLWTAAIGASLYAGFNFRELYRYDAGLLTGIVAGVILSLFLLFFVIHPRIRKFRTEQKRLSSIIKELTEEALVQMAPLNRLFDWDILPRMMTKTVPKLEFDPFFTEQRLADLKNSFGWNEAFNQERSVLYSHSGQINGNPFVFCRTRKMVMGSKTYTGTKTIFWTTVSRNSDGRYITIPHSQTLVASITKPFPEYRETTRLFYANDAAPDLIFTRTPNGLAGKEQSVSYKRTKRALKRKAEDFRHSDYAMMTNEEFEVAFDTRDRNNNQQFALLFTPLAQENILALLKDKDNGYGDDFEFDKFKKINTVIPDHLQQMDFELDPDKYRGYDFDKVRVLFLSRNAELFRAIYFSMAPLLCVPVYQQQRPETGFYKTEVKSRSSYWEHEALANFWGQDHFRSPDCVTDCILKTEEKTNGDGTSNLVVSAYGYRKESHVTYVGKLGGDGKIHNVPVRWDEYLPVTGKGRITMKEDDITENSAVSQNERISHIDRVLGQSGMSLYRKHIASKILP